MRIISGKYKGRKLKGFDIVGTRPTMDRVKESLFSMIQNNVQNATVLDLFAGSGNLGIEAISIGAEKLILVDKSKEAIKVLKENTKDMTENIEIIESDYKKFLNETKETFDIIFLDPPYDSPLLNKSLKIIEDRNLINDGGLVICEFTSIRPQTNLTLVKNKNYGNKKIQIFIS